MKENQKKTLEGHGEGHMNGSCAAEVRRGGYRGLEGGGGETDETGHPNNLPFILPKNPFFCGGGPTAGESRKSSRAGLSDRPAGSRKKLWR